MFPARRLVKPVFSVALILLFLALFVQLSPVPIPSHNISYAPYSSGSGNGTLYSVIFKEYGLPSGTQWSIDFNGTPGNTTGTTLAFEASNGSYQYQPGTVAGYYSPSTSVVSVSGKNITVSLHFSPINTPYETIQLFFEGTGLGAIIGGTAVSVFLKRKGS